MISLPRPDVPLASIVIVGLRKAPLLLDCLTSVGQHVSNVAYEVIVVLNDPVPELLAALEDKVSGAQLQPFRANLGFGGAVNYGAGLARGQYVVLLNDDCRVTPGWLESLVALAQQQPHCGLVGSAAFNTDGSLQEAGGIVWSDGTTATVSEGAEPPLRNLARQVDYCSGASLLVRREVWTELGGLDDRYYPAYYEDVDLSFRAFEAGWATWYQPASAVYHARSVSTTSGERHFFHGRSRRAFVERWSTRLASHEPPGELSRAVRRAAVRPLPRRDQAHQMASNSVSPIRSANGHSSPVIAVGSPPVMARLDLRPAAEGHRPPAAAGPADAVFDLELTAARRELELRQAYASMLEDRLQETHRHTESLNSHIEWLNGQIEWLHSHVDHITHVFDAGQGQRVEELALEQRRAEEAEAALAVAQQTLLAERGRISYRLMQRLTARYIRSVNTVHRYCSFGTGHWKR